MHNISQDIRFAIRQLRKSPGFASTVILTLALGIGATTGIFSLVNAVLLRPLPFPQPDQLMELQHESHRTGTIAPQSLSYPDFFDWRSQNRSFSSMASFRDGTNSLTNSGTAQVLQSETVSSDFFRVLGAHPELGRDFLSDEEKAGHRAAMLSHQLWERVFDSRPDIVGKTITLDGYAYTVAGVMPASFSFPFQNPAPQIWISVAADAFDPDGDTPLTAQRGAHMLDAIGRLKPGVTPDEARAELSHIASNLAAQYPESNKFFTAAQVKPELDALVGDSRPALRILFAAVSLVLLIGCANVAGLLLARASQRRAEIALRAALGAGRAEIIRQMLIESLLLSLLGGALGLGLSTVFLQATMHFVPQNLPRLDSISVDSAVLGFTVVASVLTGLLFGVVPAVRMSRLDPSVALRDGIRSVTAGRGQHRLHSTLVIAETALGLVLLIASGLFIRSFVRVLSVDPGFDRRNVLTADLSYPSGKGYADKVARFYDQLLPRLAALPGVKSAAAGWPLPFSGDNIGVTFEVEGHPTAKSDQPASDVRVVTPNFFNTLRIPIVRGRDFTAADSGTSTPVVIVSESWAKKFLPGEDPIGKHIKPGLSDGLHPTAMHEIIAVVGDVKQRSLTKDPRPTFYLPVSQCGVTAPTLVLRTSGDPTALSTPLRILISSMNGDVPIYHVRTLDDLLSAAASAPRFTTLLLSSFAAMALLLSAVGLYGVLSYMVAQRTNEMGLRMALGAQRRDLLALILRRGLILAMVGAAIGLSASTVLTRLVSNQLYGVHAFDPLTYLGVTALLVGVSAVASLSPAWRASRVDPMKTLREQ
ncbi:MAG: ABC transporter permease [Acidobacteriaceae bacterium]|nr:ABC transporter permease [Acidobacteriaceae bacterium]